MPTRILRDGILTSKAVDQLDYGAEVLYRRLMSVVDDYGRFTADPVLIRAHCYPRRTDTVTIPMIERWLEECASTVPVLVRIYEVGGDKYLELLKFGQRQRSASKWPPPPTVESMRRRIAADCGELRQLAADCGEPRQLAADCGSRARANVVEGVVGDVCVDGGAAGDVCVRMPAARRNSPQSADDQGIGDWDEFRAAYPVQMKIEAGCRAYVGRIRSAVNPAHEHAALMAGLERHMKSASWRDDSGELRHRFIPSMEKFIMDGLYLDSPPPWKPPPKRGRHSAIEGMEGT